MKAFNKYINQMDLNAWEQEDNLIELEELEWEQMEKLEEVDNYYKDIEKNHVQEQWSEIESNYSFEFYQAIEKATREVESIEDIDLSDIEHEDVYQDVNFYEVVNYLVDVTPEDILGTFVYGHGTLYIDKQGQGLMII